jgi:hypothetical protein
MLRNRGFFAASIILLAVASSGCVRSRVLVTSEPEGAVVTMNGVNLGKTPVDAPFTWYWYYDFVAEADGFEPTGTRERFRAPVWLWPGFDLLMEAMPFYVTDRKRVHLVLTPVDERPKPQYATGG